ncbi:hypothetical protein ACROYT_G033551 [Oculina patagonica]
MARKYGTSLRWRVIFLYVNHHLPPREIVRLLKVGKTFVHKVLKLYAETKGVDYSLNRRKKARLIDGRAILLVRSIIDQYPELYLDELRDWIYFRTGETYSIPTLSRCLRRIGLSVKKLQLIAKERDERRRANFRRYMAQFNKHELLFVDESSKDDRTFQRKYAQGLKGMRVSRKGNFTRGTSPYSPDMNPIELCFGDGKSWLRRHHDVCDKYPKRCFEIALQQVSSDSCAEYFAFCGYM